MSNVQGVTFERRRPGDRVARRLLERDDWLDELAAAFVGRSRPSSVVIEGEPGLGKTALLNAACQSATEAGLFVLRARGSLIEAESPFGVVRQLFEPVDAEMVPNEHQRPLALIDRAASPERRPVSADLLQGLYLSLAQLAARQPVVVAVDDLHWSDRESLAWVNFLVRRLQPGQIWFLGATTRRVPGVALSEVDTVIAEPGTRLFSLRPLGEGSVGRLVSQHLGAPAEASFTRACHATTGGNPFLLFSLLSAVDAEGLTQKDAEDALDTLAPPAVARSILARLAGLPTEAHSLLRGTAILGDGIDHRLVAALVGVDPAVASQTADALAEVHLLRRDRPLRFAYPLERATVCGEMGPARRARAHAEAARLLDRHGASPDDVARHLLSTEPAGDEWAARRLEQAARRAASRGDWEVAVRSFVRALAEPPQPARRARLLAALASAEAATGRPSAFDHLREAADLGVDAVDLADAAFRCVEAFAGKNCPPESVALLRQLPAQLGDQHHEFRLRLELALAAWDVGPTAVSVVTPLLEAALDKGRSERTPPERLALAHVSFSLTFAADRLSAKGAAEMAEQALDGDGPALDDDVSVVMTARALTSLVRAGEFRRAEELGRTAEAAAATRGLATATAERATVVAHSLVLQGVLGDAEAAARRALAAMEGRPWRSRSLAVGILASSLLDQGRTTEASSVLKDAPPRAVPKTVGDLVLLEQRARLRMMEGRLGEAWNELVLVGQWAEEQGIRNPVVTSWRAVASSVLKMMGQVSEARRMANEELELARVFGAPWACGRALRAAAQVSDQADRRELLTEAVCTLETSGALLEYARASIDLGTVLREEGQCVAARTALRKGADLAFRYRAQPLAERAARELRAAGARPRRLALAGSEALTPAERRVAVLAAEGKINATIAASLFVSEKTVEGHLSHVYQKLGIRSRLELREILARTSDRPAGLRSNQERPAV